jgi:hypothetical protein
MAQSPTPLDRRDFVRLLGSGALAATWLGAATRVAAAPDAAGEAPVVLSTTGSGRATGSGGANMITSVGPKTHVAWLDAEPAGFRVRIRTLDRPTGLWSPPVTVGEALDNHGAPGLTADRQGFLHLVYYPHHRPFRYRRSLRPNDASAWGPEIQFGESLSYPVLLCAADDTLILTCRRYHEANDHRNELQLWKKPAGGAWQRADAIMRSRYLGYVLFQDATAWGPDHRTIHLSCRIYETNPRAGEKAIETLGYLKSPDAGTTWTRWDGTPVTLPATAETIDVLLRGGDATGRTFFAGTMAVSAAGVPHLVHSVREAGIARSYLATPAPGGGWRRQDLHAFLPPAWRDHDLVMIGGGITFSPSGRATIAATLVKPGPGEADFAHASSQIVRLWSDDGARTFASEVLRPLEGHGPHWLPNVERATGPHAVPAQPGIIYTAGSGGAGLHERELNNQVWWRPANPGRG